MSRRPELQCARCDATFRPTSPSPGEYCRRCLYRQTQFRKRPSPKRKIKKPRTCRYCSDVVPRKPRLKNYCSSWHYQYYQKGYECVKQLCVVCNETYQGPMHAPWCSPLCKMKWADENPRVFPTYCKSCGKYKPDKYRALCDPCYGDFRDTHLRKV